VIGSKTLDRLIKREFNSVAVYTKTPSEPQELYQQQVVFSQASQQWMHRVLPAQMEHHYTEKGSPSANSSR